MNAPAIHEARVAVPANLLRGRRRPQIALVGLPRAGKSTIFNLLLRFYDPEKGAVRLDGIDVRDLGLHDLRRALATVPQEPVLFSSSVADNIRYGRPRASDDEVRSAAQKAHAHDFIVGLQEASRVKGGR